MSEHDDELDFDFFRRRAARADRRRGGRAHRRAPARDGRRRRPGPGRGRAARAGGRAAAPARRPDRLRDPHRRPALIWWQSCNGASKRNWYKNYMEKVGTMDYEGVGIRRARVERRAHDAGIKATELAGRGSTASPSRRSWRRPGLRAASPGPLRGRNRKGRGARVPGQRPPRSADTFRRAAGRRTSTPAACCSPPGAAPGHERRRLGRPVQGARAGERLRNQSEGSPASPPRARRFVPNPDFASSRFWVAILERFRRGFDRRRHDRAARHRPVSTKALPGARRSRPNPRTPSPRAPISVSRSRSRTPETRRRCR